MAAASNQGPFGLRSARQAVLVIHGIGEQNPYETLDSFARGLFTYLSRSRGLNARLCPLEIAHRDWTQAGMRIGLFAPGRALPECPAKDAPASPDDQPAAYVDIFEYYWAPETEDKLSAAETVKWVLRTDFTPLRYFADNLQEMIGVQRLSWGRALWRSLKLYMRELARVVFLYLPMALGLGLVLRWISQQRPWGAALKNLAAGLTPYAGWMDGLILLFYLLFLLMAWFGWQSLGEWRRQRGRSIEAQGEKLWLVCDVLFGLVFLAAAVALDLRAAQSVAWGVLRVLARNWQPLAGVALAAAVSYALTAYVADVTVYVNTDAKSKSYAARNAILDGSTAALKQLLEDDAYDRVILAGHSLGSVIAYDTINEMLSQFNAAPGPAADRPDPPLALGQLQKLKGLCTFGSPLDKIYYFFREHVKRDQAIRAQILSMLHSFRKKRSGRDYGEFEFRYSFGQLDAPEPLVWINAWARMDTVSANLKFYRVDHQRQFHYAVPVLAHLRYWSDPAFYDYVAASLLFR